MIPHFPITYNITIIPKGVCGMIPYISLLFFRKECTG
jgi:hypothetical protein